jgi:putative methyltransferase (TIGR04325 family)
MALLQRVILPILALARKHLLPIAFPPPPPLLEYAPEGWNTDLGKDGEKGWNDPAATTEERAKWAAFCDVVQGTGPLGFCHEHTDLTITRDISFHNVHITFGYVLALAAHQNTTLSVLDYGGGLGHYYHIGKALHPDLDLDYHCWEVPAMAEAGRQLNPEIQWHTDKSCLNKSYDLIMISGSLQYAERWQEFLCEISKAVSVGKYLYLTRVPIVEEVESFVAVQKAFNTRLLHWQINKEVLLQAVEQAGFQVIREFVIGDRPFILNAPEQCELRGWLFRKRS